MKIKTRDIDFYRWLVYSLVLLGVAFASFKWHAVWWFFVIVLVIALGDFIYTQSTKYTGL